MKKTIYFIFLSFLVGCGVSKNPAATDFNTTDSDTAAIAVADDCMAAMGGRKNWDAARFLAWNFFGSRKLCWDKQTGQVRVDFFKEDLQILVNIHNMKGQVKLNGEIQSHPDTLSKYLQKGKDVWINDSYWLVMPYKLKDSGVTLTYLREAKTTEGALADVLQLTFEKVGKTPQNKYHVYVDKKTKLVSQWDFFTNASDEEARFSTPWKDYKNYANQILLSGDRGRNKLTEIALYKTLPDSIFEEFAEME